jgi:hypothetical protein
MNTRRLVVVVLAAMIASPILTVSGGYTSPNNGQTCTLSWLAAQTSAVQTTQDPDIYELVDDVTILSNDELVLSAGETLKVDILSSITVYGNMIVSGSQESPFNLETIGGAESQVPNLIWSHSVGKWYDIAEMKIKGARMQLEDEFGDKLDFIAPPYTDDIDPIELPGGLVKSVVQKWMKGDQPIISDLDYLAKRTDSDNDGMPDWWEYWHFIVGINALPAGDPDVDDLDNIDEYILGTDPNNPDTDRDGLDDGDETVEGTNPKKSDSDGDTLKDGFEVNVHGSDPLDTNSDTDDLPDQRDNMPTTYNRRFAFLMERQFSTTYECWKVANDLDDNGWTVYLYSDYCYHDPGNWDGEAGNEELNDDVLHWCMDDNEIEWNDFSSTTVDVDDEVMTEGIFKHFIEHPNPDAGSLGSDIIIIYIDSHGSTDSDLYEQVYSFTFNDAGHDEEDLEDVFNRLDNDDCIDLIWASTCGSYGWYNDLIEADGFPVEDTGDDLNAGARVVVLTEADDTEDGPEVWETILEAYDEDKDDGFYTTFRSVLYADRDYNQCWYEPAEDEEDDWNLDKFFLW